MAETVGTGYYAEYNPNDDERKVIRVGYTTSKIVTNNSVLLADDLLTAAMSSQFSSFLFCMYQTGLYFNSETETLTPSLDSVMTEKGITGDYANVKILDIMALLGAVKNIDISLYIPTVANPSPTPRPTVLSVLANEANIGDSALMISVIKFLGLNGLVKYIYAEGGLSFEEFLDLFRYFYPDTRKRRPVFKDLVLFLRQRNIMFTSDQHNKLLS